MQEMTDAERVELAKRVQQQRMATFGSKSGAYRAARLNATTWDRIETGERVRDDRLIAAVKTLWPASGGDWRNLDTEDEPDDMSARLRDLQQRVSQLEATVYGRLDQEEGEGDVRSAPNNQAAVSAADDYADDEDGPNSEAMPQTPAEATSRETPRRRRR